MAVDEVRARLRRRLVELVGMEEADLLMDRPSGGWDDLVTKEWLHLELAVIDAKFAVIDSRFDAVDSRLASLDSRMDALVASLDSRMGAVEHELRAQTWRIIAAMTGLLGALVVAIKL